MTGRLTQVAAGVLVATSELYITNSTVIAGQNGGCLLVDPALTVAELRQLAADLAKADLRPVAGFATHPHWDHVLWCVEFGEVPRYASAAAAADAERDRDHLVEALGHEAHGHDLELFARLRPLEPGAQALRWAGPETVVVTHEGHAPGHSALFLPDTGTLLAGDMLSDIEIPLLDLRAADPIGSCRAGLGLLARLPVRQLVPGHGTVAGPEEFRRRVAAYAAYLDGLERGEDVADPRITAGWLQTEHERQLQHARERGTGADNQRPGGDSSL